MIVVRCPYSKADLGSVLTVQAGSSFRIAIASVKSPGRITLTGCSLKILTAEAIVDVNQSAEKTKSYRSGQS